MVFVTNDLVAHRVLTSIGALGNGGTPGLIVGAVLHFAACGFTAVDQILRFAGIGQRIGGGCSGYGRYSLVNGNLRLVSCSYQIVVAIVQGHGNGCILFANGIGVAQGCFSGVGEGLAIHNTVEGHAGDSQSVAIGIIGHRLDCRTDNGYFLGSDGVIQFYGAGIVADTGNRELVAACIDLNSANRVVGILCQRRAAYAAIHNGDSQRRSLAIVGKTALAQLGSAVCNVLGVDGKGAADALAACGERDGIGIRVHRSIGRAIIRFHAGVIHRVGHAVDAAIYRSRIKRFAGIGIAVGNLQRDALLCIGTSAKVTITGCGNSIATYAVVPHMSMNHDLEGLAAADGVVAVCRIYNLQSSRAFIDVVLVGQGVLTGINNGITILDRCGNRGNRRAGVEILSINALDNRVSDHLGSDGHAH